MVFATEERFAVVDKDSPKYPDYMQEAKALFEEYEKKMEALRPPASYRGLDGWDTSELSRECHRKLKELQKKYGFL